jgi:hypothetical protein
MILFNKLLIGIIAISYIVGCASGPPFQLQPAIKDQVTIYAFRTSSIVGGANSDIVAVNDHFIGRLNSGTYAVYRTEPGLIKITRKTGSRWASGQDSGWGLGGLVGAVDGFVEMTTFTGKANEIYFIRFPHGELVANDEALEMMDGLENVTP